MEEIMAQLTDEQKRARAVDLYTAALHEGGRKRACSTPVSFDSEGTVVDVAPRLWRESCTAREIEHAGGGGAGSGMVASDAEAWWCLTKWKRQVKWQALGPRSLFMTDTLAANAPAVVRHGEVPLSTRGAWPPAEVWREWQDRIAQARREDEGRHRTIDDVWGDYPLGVEEAEIEDHLQPFQHCPRCGARIEWELRQKRLYVTATTAPDALDDFTGRNVWVGVPPGTCTECELVFPVGTLEAQGRKWQLEANPSCTGERLRDLGCYFNTTERDGGTGPLLQTAEEIISEIPGEKPGALADKIIIGLAASSGGAVAIEEGEDADGERDYGDGLDFGWMADDWQYGNEGQQAELGYGHVLADTTSDPCNAVLRQELREELLTMMVDWIALAGPHPRGEAVARALAQWRWGVHNRKFARDLARVVKHLAGDDTSEEGIMSWIARLKRRMPEAITTELARRWEAAGLLVALRLRDEEPPRVQDGLLRHDAQAIRVLANIRQEEVAQTLGFADAPEMYRVGVETDSLTKALDLVGVRVQRITIPAGAEVHVLRRQQ